MVLCDVYGCIWNGYIWYMYVDNKWYEVPIYGILIFVVY